MTRKTRGLIDLYVSELESLSQDETDYLNVLVERRNNLRRQGRRYTIVVFIIFAATYIDAIGLDLSLFKFSLVQLPPELLLLALSFVASQLSDFEVLQNFLNRGIAALARRKHKNGAASVLGYIDLDITQFSRSLILENNVNSDFKFSQRLYLAFRNINNVIMSVIQTACMMWLFVRAFNFGGIRVVTAVLAAFVVLFMMLESLSLRSLHLRKLTG